MAEVGFIALTLVHDENSRSLVLNGGEFPCGNRRPLGQVRILKARRTI